MRDRRHELTRPQVRALDRLARAGEAGQVLATDEAIEFRAPYAHPTHTLHSLVRRGLAQLVDDSDEPFLWRVTLAGLVMARRWRGRLPSLDGGRE